MDINKIADFDVNEQQWRVVNMPDDPESLISDLIHLTWGGGGYHKEEQ